MTAGIILAAGQSERMGRPKAFLKHVPSGRTFVQQLVATLQRAGVSTVLIVGRPGDELLVAEASRCGVTLVPNPNADEGQLSSLLAGLDAAVSAGAHSVLVLPVDVPLISTASVARVLASAAAGPQSIIRAVYEGRHGHPVLFKREVFEELRRADPSIGAREVVRRDPARVLDVETGEPGVAFDLDTPADYERAFGRKL